MIPKHLLILLLFFSLTSLSQNYIPLDTTDYVQRNSFLEQLKANNTSVIKDIKDTCRGTKRNELIDFYNEFYEDITEEVKNKKFTFNSDFEVKLNELVAVIQKNNPSIPKELKILVAKDNVPNAACLPDGTFIVHMGVFNYMDNEDQVASILCHEIAHNILDHSLRMILQMVEENEADKKTLKSINENSLNRSKSAFEFLKNRFYKKGEKRRQHEIAADSLGYVLFKNSGYQKEAFLNALIKLRDFDSIPPKVLQIETYKDLYNLPNHPFKDSWLQKEDFTLYNYDFYKEKLHKDSISTHPEAVQRIEILKVHFPELKNEIAPKVADQKYLDLQQVAYKEILPNLFYSEDYGIGIYRAMQYLQDKKDEDYHKLWLGKMFSKIYEARKNYNLNRYLERVNPKEQSESYMQFLNFMWNLTIDDIKYIASYYNPEEE